MNEEVNKIITKIKQSSILNSKEQTAFDSYITSLEGEKERGKKAVEAINKQLFSKIQEVKNMKEEIKKIDFMENTVGKPLYYLQKNCFGCKYFDLEGDCKNDEDYFDLTTCQSNIAIVKEKETDISSIYYFYLSERENKRKRIYSTSREDILRKYKELTGMNYDSDIIGEE